MYAPGGCSDEAGAQQMQAGSSAADNTVILSAVSCVLTDFSSSSITHFNFRTQHKHNIPLV